MDCDIHMYIHTYEYIYIYIPRLGNVIKWNSINQKEIMDCDEPVLFKNSKESIHINQGSFGNSKFLCIYVYVYRIICL
jgi:hypothetical protein